jgi:hypothetical protein
MNTTDRIEMTEEVRDILLPPFYRYYTEVREVEPAGRHLYEVKATHNWDFKNVDDREVLRRLALDISHRATASYPPHEWSILEIGPVFSLATELLPGLLWYKMGPFDIAAERTWMECKISMRVGILGAQDESLSFERWYNENDPRIA